MFGPSFDLLCKLRTLINLVYLELKVKIIRWHNWRIEYSAQTQSVYPTIGLSIWWPQGPIDEEKDRAHIKNKSLQTHQYKHVVYCRSEKSHKTTHVSSWRTFISLLQFRCATLSIIPVVQRTSPLAQQTSFQKKRLVLEPHTFRVRK